VRPPPVQEETSPEIQLEGVGVRFFRGNELRAVARAAHATFRRGNGDLAAQSVRLRFLAASDRPEIEVAAREADGNLHSQEAQAKGGVRIAETAGAAGVTEAASLDAKARRVSGTLPVDLVGQGYRIRAEKGFVLDFSTPGALALQGPIDTTVGGLR
jgi:hypothetical protein